MDALTAAFYSGSGIKSDSDPLTAAFRLGEGTGENENGPAVKRRSSIPGTKPQALRGPIDETLSSLGAGLAATGEAVGGTMEMLGLPGGETTRKYWQEVGQTDALRRPDYLAQGDIVSDPGRLADWRWWVRSLGENAPNMAAMMIPGMGAAAGARAFGWGAKAIRAAGLAGGWGGSFTVEAGGAYGQAKDEMAKAGILDADAVERIATLEGMAVGATNAILELLPFDNLFLKQAGADRIVKRMVRQALLEGSTEAVQEGVNIVAEKLGHKPDMEFDRAAVGRILESAVVGGALGGIAGGTVGTAVHRRNVKFYNQLGDQTGVRPEVYRMKDEGLPDKEIVGWLDGRMKELRGEKPEEGAGPAVSYALAQGEEAKAIGQETTIPEVDAKEMVSYLLYGEGKYEPPGGIFANGKKTALNILGIRDKTRKGVAEGAATAPEEAAGPGALTATAAAGKDIATAEGEDKEKQDQKRQEVRKQAENLFDAVISEQTIENQERMEQTRKEEIARKAEQESQEAADAEAQSQAAIAKAGAEAADLSQALAGDDPKKQEIVAGVMGLSERVLLSTVQKELGLEVRPAGPDRYEIVTAGGPQPVQLPALRKMLAEKGIAAADAEEARKAADTAAIRQREAEQKARKEKERIEWAFNAARETLTGGRFLTEPQKENLRERRAELTTEESARLDAVDAAAQKAAQTPAGGETEKKAETPAADIEPAPPKKPYEYPEPSEQDVRDILYDTLEGQLKETGRTGWVESEEGGKRLAAGGWISRTVAKFGRQSTTPLRDAEGKPATLNLSKDFLAKVIAKARRGESLTDQQQAVHDAILAEAGAERGHAYGIAAEGRLAELGFRAVNEGETFVTEDLAPGDEMIIDHELFRVTDIDDGGNVTLKDGTTRKVKDGEAISGVDYIRQPEMASGGTEFDFGAAAEEKTPPGVNKSDEDLSLAAAKKEPRPKPEEETAGAPIVQPGENLTDSAENVDQATVPQSLAALGVRTRKDTAIKEPLAESQPVVAAEKIEKPASERGNATEEKNSSRLSHPPASLENNFAQLDDIVKKSEEGPRPPLSGGDGTPTQYSMEDVPVRSRPVPREAGEKVISSYGNNAQVKKNPDYEAAKGGDREAAARLVETLVKPETIAEAKRRFGDGVIYAAPHAIEATGENWIPLALATLYAAHTGGKVDGKIVQTVKAFHTGAGAIERLISRARFSGDVVKYGRYVLVDDTTTLGGTLAEMADHIQANGGQVVGIIVLTNASRTGTFKASHQLTREVERRFGHVIQELFGIQPHALTAAEAGYISGFRDADSLRNRAAQAVEERRHRLLSKEVGAPAAEAGVDTPTGKKTQYQTEDNSSLTDPGLLRDLVHRLAATVKGITVIDAGTSGALIKTRSGETLSIRAVQQIDPDEIALTLAYGPESQRPGKIIAGSYVRSGETEPHTGVVRLVRNAAGFWTLTHEFTHFLEDIGVISNEDKNILNRKIKALIASDPATYGRLQGMSPAEQRAEYIGRTLAGAYDAKTPAGRIVQKIKDVIDQILNVLGIRTAGGVVRDIREGKIYGGNEATGATTAARYALLEKLRPFFSQMERIVLAKMGGRMPVEQLRKMLKGNGVTDAEMENLIGGLTGNVTKQQVLDEIKVNSVEFKDVVLGDQGGDRSLNGEELLSFHKLLKQADYLGFDSLSEARAAIRDYDDWKQRWDVSDFPELAALGDRYHDSLTGGRETRTHFSQYVEPGAVSGSYREMFVTAPDNGKQDRFGIMYTGRTWKVTEHGNPLSMREFPTEEAAQDTADNYNENSARFERDWQDGHSQYSDITNPIVRIRFDEREGKAVVKPGGPTRERILFIEEMQGPSDINQQKMPDWLRRRIYDIGVKRVLAYAKEHRFDAVAWTTGEMQADRYDLSKHLSEIHYSGSNLTAYDHGGKAVIKQTAVMPEDLPDHIGKELAERLMNQTAKGTLRSLTGLDLKVGGEGIKRLYDQTLPAMFKKYGKESVGTTTLKKTDMPLSEYEKYPADHPYRKKNAPAVSFVTITAKTPDSYPQYALTDEAERVTASAAGAAQRAAGRGIAMLGARTSPKLQEALGAFGKHWQEFWRPFSTAPDGDRILAKRYQAMGNVARAVRFIDEIHEKVKAYPDQVKQDLFWYLDGSLPIANLPEGVRETAEMIRRRTEVIGEMLVDRGIIDEGQFNKYKGRYIHYMYAKHVLGEDKPIFLTSTGKLNLSYTKSRNPDLTLQQRKELGLIEDASVAVPVGMGKALTDIAKFDYLASIADNPDWVWKPSVVKVPIGRPLEHPVRGRTRRWVKMGIGKLVEEVKIYDKMAAAHPTPEVEEIRRILREALDAAEEASSNMPADFVQLPNSKGYGPLAGAYVRAPIADDLMPVLDVATDRGKLMNAIIEIERQGMATFKMGKVALNVPTAVRNIFSNIVQNNMRGRALAKIPGDIIRACESMKAKDEHYEEAFGMGIFNTNWFVSEINDVLDEFRKVKAGRIDQILIALKNVARYYGKIDDINKLSIFIEQREAGKSIDEAALEALKWGMDYSLTSRSIKGLRQTIMPFATYQYKIAPLIAESLKKRPWVLAKFALIYPIAKMIAMGVNDLDDDDWDDLAKQLPAYIKKSGSMMILPWKTDKGQWQWVNLEYFFPWGNYLAIARDMKAADLGEGLRDAGISNPFLSMFYTGLTAREDQPPLHSYFGTPIYNQLDQAPVKAAKVLEYMANTWMPSMLTRQGAIGYTARAIAGGEDRWGREVTAGQALGRWFGVNVISVSPEQTRAQASVKIQDLRKEQARIEANPAYDEEEKKGYERRLNERLAMLAEEAPAAVLPITKAKGHDPVYEALREMAQKGILHTGPPSRSVEIAGVPYKMSLEQYRTYLDRSSDAARQRLGTLVGSIAWEKMADKVKSERVGAIVAHARKAARQRVKADIARENRAKTMGGSAP